MIRRPRRPAFDPEQEVEPRRVNGSAKPTAEELGQDVVDVEDHLGVSQSRIEGTPHQRIRDIVHVDKVIRASTMFPGQVPGRFEEQAQGGSENRSQTLLVFAEPVLQAADPNPVDGLLPVELG